MNQKAYTADGLGGKTFTAAEIAEMTKGQLGVIAVRQRIRQQVRVAGFEWRETDKLPPTNGDATQAIVMREFNEPLYYSPRIPAAFADTQPINPKAMINGNPFWHVFPGQATSEIRVDDLCPFGETELDEILEIPQSVQGVGHLHFQL